MLHACAGVLSCVDGDGGALGCCLLVTCVRGRIAECVGGCVRRTVSVCYVSTGNAGGFPWMLARCGFFSAPRQWLGHRDPHGPCNSLEGIQNLLFLRVV